MVLWRPEYRPPNKHFSWKANERVHEVVLVSCFNELVLTANEVTERGVIQTLLTQEKQQESSPTTQVWTIEVNPRFTASVEVIERANGVSGIASHAAACSEILLWDLMTQQKKQVESLPALRQPLPDIVDRVHGKAILFAKCPVTVSESFANWTLKESLVQPWPNFADISPAGTLIKTSRPVVTVFASGESDREVEQRLRERVAEVEARLYAQ